MMISARFNVFVLVVFPLQTVRKQQNSQVRGTRKYVFRCDSEKRWRSKKGGKDEGRGQKKPGEGWSMRGGVGRGGGGSESSRGVAAETDAVQTVGWWTGPKTGPRT